MMEFKESGRSTFGPAYEITPTEPNNRLVIRNHDYPVFMKSVTLIPYEGQGPDDLVNEAGEIGVGPGTDVRAERQTPDGPAELSGRLAEVEVQTSEIVA